MKVNSRLERLTIALLAFGGLALVFFDLSRWARTVGLQTTLLFLAGLMLVLLFTSIVHYASN